MLQPAKEKEMNHYLAAFAAAEQKRTKAPAWLKHLRANAIAQFERLGFPTTRNEEWKYTNIAPILKHDFRPAQLVPQSVATLDDFTYPEASAESLAGIDLAIEPGDRIAVIGRVASGKSTLGRVLCGLYQPTGGQMLIDGIDSRQYRPQDLRSAFRFVAQDSDLFSGSIKDNLSLGAGQASDEDLLLAAFYEPALLEPLKKPMPALSFHTTPLLELVKYLMAQPDLRSARLQVAGAELSLSR